MDDNENIEAGSDGGSFAGEDWNDPEQDEVPKWTEPDVPMTTKTRKGGRKRTGMRYCRYGDDFLIDKIRPEELGEELVNVDELPTEHQGKAILKRNSGMPMEIMLKSKIVRETLKAKSLDLDKGETGNVTVGENLRGLLEKLADDKSVVSKSDKDGLKVTILKKGEVTHGETSMKTREPENKEVVRSLLERITEDILRRTTFKEKVEHLGIDQEPGERPTPERDAEEENLSGRKKNGTKVHRRVMMSKIVSA